MWRAFTRETPARRGWALVIAAVSLAATVALAQYVTDQRRSLWLSWKLHEIPGWPLTFELPADFVLEQAGSSLEDGSPDLIRSRAVFRSTGGDGRRFEIEFRQLPPMFSMEDFVAAMIDNAPPAFARIQVGGLEGLLMAGPRRTQTELLAVAGREDGLTLSLRYSGSNERRHGLEVFEAICRSVALRDGD